MSPRAKKEKPEPGPDDLVRESAGTYRTGDDRFHVEKSDMGWYLVDTQQTNEFGQQLIHGPLGTLDAIRAAIPGARDLKPLLRVRPTKSAEGKAPAEGQAAAAGRAHSGNDAAGQTPRDGQKSPPKRDPPPPPQTWIDRLPSKEQAHVRQLIRALEKEGLPGAEELVRRHRDDSTSTIAARLIEHQLRALVDDQPEADRERARATVRRVVEILSADGLGVTRPAPRWALVEVAEDEATPKARIRPEI
jgi:hypothetical protein